MEDQAKAHHMVDPDGIKALSQEAAYSSIFVGKVAVYFNVCMKTILKVSRQPSLN